MAISDDMLKVGEAARAACYEVARLGTAEKNEVLLRMADGLIATKETLQAENEKDLAAGREKELSKAMLDRLTLSDKVIEGMAAGLREVAALADPVGEILDVKKRPSGIEVGRMRIPLGVIGIIYESRPNVTADAAGLCLKSGNAVVLRGGSEAINSNLAIAAVLRKACEGTEIPVDAVQVISTTEREAITELLKLEEQIDLIIPRGGESLIRFVSENSRIPVVKHYKGVCHVYVDAGADLDMALNIAFNAKVQRPGVCNSMETLLIHKDIAESFLPLIARKYWDAGVEIRGCGEVLNLALDSKEATEEDWYAEYLGLTVAIKIVDDIDEAMGHIAKYGSLHTESIVTNDYTASQRFLREVNSSTVMVNASTRFADGHEFGLGAEIGISTTKLHSYGPMGLEDLTTRKFIVFGSGQIRE